MNLINDKIENLYQTLDSKSMEQFNDLLKTKEINKNSFFDDVLISGDSISVYPENIDELLTQLLNVSKLNYTLLDDDFLDNLKDLLESIDSQNFDGDIPIFTYTL